MPLRYLQIFPSSSAQACISFHISNQTILKVCIICSSPDLPREQWPKVGSESLLKVFKAFSHLQCPLLTVTFMCYTLRHRRLPSQYQRYDRLLGILWEKSHFYAVIVNLKAKHLVTFDGLNHCKIKKHKINTIYRQLASIFKINSIKKCGIKKTTEHNM